jgi:hypothetical protein
MDTDITDPSGVIKYGDWVDLHATQPYVPLLKGGEAFNRAYEAGKYESYNGDFVGPVNFILGVDTDNNQISSQQSDGKIGSWTTGIVGDILVAKTGAVLKVTAVGASVLDYSVLLGTTEEIQNGFQYPEVFRAIEGVGGGDNSDEHYYFDNGGTYPWPG